MKVGSLNIPPADRVAFRVICFAFGVLCAWVTLKHITTGVTRYGGVENTRADQPFAYWFVVATMAYITVLLFCAALMPFWKHMAADWKPAVLVALPMFAVAMWCGISRAYEDIGWFAAAMALGTLHVAQMAVLSFRRLRALRSRGCRQRRGAP